jgi:hypothetical protein
MRPISRCGARGQAMVEYAFILVPFLLLSLGVFDFGRGVFVSHMVVTASREAARKGITWPPPAGELAPPLGTNLSGALSPADRLCFYARAAAMLPDVTRPAVDQPQCGDLGGRLTVQAYPDINGGIVRVDVTYDFSLLLPFFGPLTPDPMAISTSSTMYVEQ